MRETENSSASVTKLRVQTELSDSIIESWDVLSQEKKQKSYICSSIWSALNCLLWWKAPRFPEAAAAGSGSQAQTFCFIPVNTFIGFPRCQGGYWVTLDNWPLLEEILIFFLLNWNITQGQVFKYNSCPSKTCKDLIQATCFSSTPWMVT